jgi:phytoene desaturase
MFNIVFIMLNKNKIGIIGSGVAGLASASVLAHNGKEVHLFEKNLEIGGRARQFKYEGFTFDMGPSWYWMPDVMERFFNRFSYQTSDFFELIKLDPGFQMIFKDDDVIKVPGSWSDMESLFEDIETGSSARLNQFMKEAEFKYKVGVHDLVYQPGLSITELIRPDLIKSLFKLQVFSSFHDHVRTYFSNPKLIALMEFPILFLGAMPKQTPALYSLMNYSGLKVGTYYPKGGFGELVKAMTRIAEEQGVQIHTSSPVEKINYSQDMALGLSVSGRKIDFDAIIGAGDYEHIERELIDKEKRNYGSKYWDKKVFAPSCLIFYLGVDKKLNHLEHHNLFFDADLDLHAKEIYETKEWPSNPLFYVCCPSKTDETVAPEGKENLFILMPIAPGIEDTEEIRKYYFNLLIKRLEKQVKESIVDQILYKRSYCIKDFKSDYNAYKGNAYGLANTLMQTANFKPKIRSKRLKNVFFTGQLTVPGPGVPPSIISGQVVADQVIKSLKR